MKSLVTPGNSFEVDEHQLAARLHAGLLGGQAGDEEKGKGGSLDIFMRSRGQVPGVIWADQGRSCCVKSSL